MFMQFKIFVNVIRGPTELEKDYNISPFWTFYVYSAVYSEKKQEYCSKIWEKLKMGLCTFI